MFGDLEREDGVEPGVLDVVRVEVHRAVATVGEPPVENVAGPVVAGDGAQREIVEAAVVAAGAVDDPVGADLLGEVPRGDGAVGLSTVPGEGLDLVGVEEAVEEAGRVELAVEVLAVGAGGEEHGVVADRGGDARRRRLTWRSRFPLPRTRFVAQRRPRPDQQARARVRRVPAGDVVPPP